jgi:predicted DNA-binding transcriptional regulator YafY
MEHSGRVLGILFRAVRGEEISLVKLANEHEVSTKSISRDIAKIRAFLAENRELTGYASLRYNSASKTYRLTSEEFLTDKEMFAMAKVILGVRAFSKPDVAGLIGKFKKFTTTDDRAKLDEIVRKELRHYTEIKHDCDHVMDVFWRLTNILHDKKEITILYFMAESNGGHPWRINPNVHGSSVAAAQSDAINRAPALCCACSSPGHIV